MIRNLSGLIKGSPRTQQARQIVLNLLNEALQAVDPRLLISRVLALENGTLALADVRLKLDDINGIFVIGAGKATGRMAEAIESLLTDHISGGLIIVPETTINDYALTYIQSQGGGHPLPSDSSIAATKQLLDSIACAPVDALIISLFSGGGSALLTLPAPKITLGDLQQTTKLMLKAGLRIDEMNTIRKHLSQVKGGQLASYIHPRRHWSLLLSDVPGDALDMIASGPTLPDPTTFSDVARIFDDNQLWDQIPPAVHHHITTGIQGRIRETPKPGDPHFHHSIHQLIGTNRDACQAALEQAQQYNFPVRILTTDCQGEAREVGDQLGRLARKLTTKPEAQVVIVGSETTVTVQQEGKGGRNTELVTAVLSHLQGMDGLVIASLSTDGVDGSTDAAGAIADSDSYLRAQHCDCSPSVYLQSNQTYHLFHALEDLIMTGPTHTNVRDITIILWLGSTE